MAEIKNLPVSLIQTSPRNPRKTFDEEKLKELAQNIEEQGLLQPITVRVIKEGETVIDEDTGEVINAESQYEIVCGERRFRAWNMLAKKSDKYNEIPCIVREMTDEQAFDAMITENLQRQDVDPVEEAIAFSLLLENGNSVDDIALRFGKSTRFVQDRVKLKGLIPELIEMLREDLIPISGAMLLAKLDVDAQKEFYNEEVNGEDGVTLSDIKDYIDDLFCVIDKAQFFSEDNFSDSIPSCSGCINNTANHGCLFYEMKGKEQKCINRECFEKKQQEYVKYRVMKEADNLVKKGEPLTFGKSVILIESPKSWDNENEKKRKEDAVRMYNDMGFEVVYDNVFDHQCWYNEGDERIAEKLENNELYRCIEVLNYRRPEFKVSFYYLKKSSSVKGACTVSKQIEAENIRQKIKRNKELMVEKSTETMREWAQSKKSYPSKSSELSLNEKLVFDVMILRGCSSDYLDSIGIKKYDTKDKSWIDYVKNNQSERMHWYREFIRENLTSNDVNFYDYMRRCQIMIFSEQYPDEFSKMNKKILDSYSKKESSLKSKLDELEKA